MIFPRAIAGFPETRTARSAVVWDICAEIYPLTIRNLGNCSLAPAVKLKYASRSGGACMPLATWRSLGT